MSNFFVGLVSFVLLTFAVVVVAAEKREDVHDSAELVQPLMVGMKAPDFTVRDVENQVFEFKADAQTKPVVLTFFRGGWCP